MKHARVAYRGAIHTAQAMPEDRMLRLANGQHVPFDGVLWLPPLEAKTIVAVGLNYSDHVAELNFKTAAKPVLFLKGPGAFVGHNGATQLPADVHQLNPECELAVVIGKRGYRIPESHAYDYVGGYTIANDYVFRDYLEDFYRPNLRVKSRDNSTPFGPWIVDAAGIADPMALDLRTTVNGAVVQQGNTRNMTFPIPAILEYISSFMTLSPGDVVLTGTPHGMAALKPGDVVTTEVSEIGSLTNTLVAAPARTA